MSNEIYQAQGPGAAFLPYTELQFIRTTDPFLGTTIAGVPDGPFNRELHKLLQNTASLANVFFGYLARTFGATTDEAPAEDTTPDPLENAPSSPANLAMHTVYYLNYEVIYTFNATDGVWVEQARMPRTSTAFIKHSKKVTITLADDLDNVAVPFPTVDSNDNAFEFTLDDLKTFYVLNLEESSPVVSVLPGLSVEEENVLRVVLSSAPVEGSDYQLVLVFEHIELL